MDTVSEIKSLHLRLLFVQLQRSYPEFFFRPLETITCDVLWQNSKIKKISSSIIWSIFEGFDREIMNFQD